MRRAVLAIAGTIVGSALLLSGKIGSAPTRPALAGRDTGAVPTPGAGTPSPTPGTTGGALLTPARPPSRTPAKPAPPSPTRNRSGLSDGTFSGPGVNERYGTIKVTITVSGGRITNVNASYPTSPSQTASINSDAIPTLRQEVLAAQSASIDAVSGASYTSEAYISSLQAALNAAHA